MKERLDELARQRGLVWPSALETHLAYQEVIERELVPAGALLVGIDPATARHHYLMPDDLRLGLHIIGGPGQGKSNALKYLASQVIDQKRKTGVGCAVLDPHGDVADHLLAECIHRGLSPSDVVYVDLKPGRWVPVLNPLHRHGASDNVRVANGLVEAITRAFGLEFVMENPLTAEAMINTAIVLLERGYSLAETTFFMHQHPKYEKAREHLLEGSVAADYWNDIAALPKRERRAELASAARRFNYFLRFTSLRHMLGQTTTGIDVGRIMDEGRIAIFNLGLHGTEVTHQAQRFIGALIMDQFKNAALRRRKHHATPFYLFADEFSYFTSYDTMEALAEARGFGLRLVLAHQRLDQLMMKDQDPRLLRAVLAIPNKLVFGAGLVEDQLQLARQACGPWIDRQKRRVELYRRGFRPILQKVELRSHAVARSETRFEAIGSAEGESTMNSYGAGAGMGSALSTPMIDGIAGDPTVSEHLQSSSFSGAGSGRSRVSSRSSGRSIGESKTDGVSDGYVTDHEEYSELGSVQFDEIEQQLFGAMQRNIRRGVGETFFVRGTEQQPCGVRMPRQEVAPISEAARGNFIEKVAVAHDGYYLRRETAHEAIAERERKLLALAEPEIVASSTPTTRRKIKTAVESEQ